MATTVTSTEQVRKKVIRAGGAGKGGGGRGPRPPTGPNGNHPRGGFGGGGGGTGDEFSPERYRIGMWVAIAAILMMFTALSSAYIVRSGKKEDWQPLIMPNLLWLSTALIIASSITFEIARKALKHVLESRYKTWLLLTVMLGLGFLAAQLLAWRQLVAQGIYISSNPNSSFFYVLTGAHGIHLLGGILSLDYLLLRAWRRRGDDAATAAHATEKRQAVVGVVALYWHFMAVLWIYLFLLLLLWR